MSVRLYSASIFGIDAHQVSVEVQSVGLTSRLSIVGLPDSSVREARHRVRCAIQSSGFSFPRGDIIVNLGPAQVPKFGAQLDLAIALGVLCISQDLDPSLVRGVCAVGELAFDGSVRPVGGVVAASDISAKNKLSKLLVPWRNQVEASFVSGIEAVGVRSLHEAVSILKGVITPETISKKINAEIADNQINFDDVSQQFAAKRALTISAAGGHNLLMTGPPGSGKSMLARRLTSILPPLAEKELLEVLKISSAVDSFRGVGQSFILERPFRAPHHSSSLVGLVGGGNVPRPGEISLAHRGVLFLDELPEFRRDVLDALRQPLETGQIDVCRARYSVTLPAQFTLVAAMNPCPCGFFGSNQQCSCSVATVQRYRGRISGPILDRIDLFVWVDTVAVGDISTAQQTGETEKMIRSVIQAKKLQSERYGSKEVTNSLLTISEVRTHCELKPAAKRMIEQFSKKFRLTGRGYVRVLKLSRTIADLEGSIEIEEVHLLEALQYRPKLNLY